MPEKKFVEINNEKIAYFEYKTDKKLRRLVLFCHGFPGGNQFEGLAKPLTEHGIILEEINYRGDKDSEGKFSFFGSMDDIEALTKELRRRYPGMPITVLGFSMGGFFACCLARKQHDLFDKIVLANPLLDLNFLDTPVMGRLWGEARTDLRLHDQAFYDQEMAKMKQEYDPKRFVSELTVQIHIVKGKKDEVLSVASVQLFYGALPNPGELIWIEDADHSLRVDEPELINILIK